MCARLAPSSDNLTHVKEIVAMQQNYVKAVGVVETLKVKDLVEDSIRLNNGADRSATMSRWSRNLPTCPRFKRRSTRRCRSW